MQNIRHCVSCLAQSSGKGCFCCRGLSFTVLISGSVLHYILWGEGWVSRSLAVMTVMAGDLSLTERLQLAVNNCSRKLENVKVGIEREKCCFKKPQSFIINFID